MNNLFGEYECRLDAKGRLKIPSQLLRQLWDGSALTLFMNRSYDAQCLMMYPKKVWDKKVENLSTLNQYNQDNKKFLRYFFRGVNMLTMDGAERILLPKSFLDWAQIDQDVIVYAYLNNIEIWSKELYLKNIEDEPDNFAALAEKVLGRTEGFLIESSGDDKSLQG
jgi:MraZ protein